MQLSLTRPWPVLYPFRDWFPVYTGIFLPLTLFGPGKGWTSPLRVVQSSMKLKEAFEFE